MLSPNFQIDSSAPTHVLLKGPFGEQERTVLVNINAKLVDESENTSLYPLTISCAVTDKLASNFMILSAADFESLSDHNSVIMSGVPILTNTPQLMHPHITNHSDQLENQPLAKIDAEEVEEGILLSKMNMT